MPTTPPFTTLFSDQPLSSLDSTEPAHSTTRTVEEVVFRLAGPVWFRLGYSAGQLWLPDAATGRLLRIAKWQPEMGTKLADTDDRTMLLEKGQSLVWLAFERSRAEWMGQYTVSNGESRPECRVCVPLQADGIVMGVLELVCENAGDPTPARLALLEQLGRRLGAFLHRMGA